MLFSRVEQLKAIRTVLYGLFNFRQIADRESYSDAAVRRLLRAAIMNAVPVEYLEEWDHESAQLYAQVFGTTQFPFLTDGQVDQEDPFFEMAIPLLDAYTDPSHIFHLESDFADLIGEQLLVYLFEGSRLFLKKEKPLKIPGSEESIFKLDYAVTVDFLRTSVRLNALPSMLKDAILVVIELGRYPLIPHFVHKDYMKALAAMVTSMTMLFQAFSHMPQSFLRRLFVQGLLFGGFDVEFLVLRPHFEEDQSEDAETIHVTFVLTSSRHHGRMSLYRHPDRQVYDPDLTDEDLFCDLEHGYNPVYAHLDLAAGQISSSESEESEHDVDFSAYEDEELLVYVNAINASDTSSTNTPQTLEQEVDEYLLPENFNQIPPGSVLNRIEALLLDRSGRVPNKSTLIALTRVREMALKMKDIIVEGASDSFPSRQKRNFVFSRNVVRTFKASRTRKDTKRTSPDEQTKSLQNDPNTSPGRQHPGIFDPVVDKENVAPASANVPTRPKNVRSVTGIITTVTRFQDTLGDWVKVCKPANRHELAVYAHPLIQSSPLFPRLHPGLNSQVSEDGRILTLFLEEIVTLRQFRSNHLQVPDYIARLERIFVDGIEAVRTLHAAGFVHADISPGNIGFNPRLGRWQLFDFDRAMPIPESLVTKRKSGTDGFRSAYSEIHQLFRPLDDYKSLILTVLKGLRGGPVYSSRFSKFLGIIDYIWKKQEIEDDWLDQVLKVYNS